MRAGAVAGRAALRLFVGFALRLFVFLPRFVFVPALRLAAAFAFGVAPPVFRLTGLRFSLLVGRAFVLRLSASGSRSGAGRLSALRLLVVKLAFKFELMLPFALVLPFEFALFALAFLFLLVLRFGRFSFALSLRLSAEADSV